MCILRRYYIYTLLYICAIIEICAFIPFKRYYIYALQRNLYILCLDITLNRTVYVCVAVCCIGRYQDSILVSR
jgi:hypothetical protein